MAGSPPPKSPMLRLAAHRLRLRVRAASAARAARAAAALEHRGADGQGHRRAAHGRGARAAQRVVLRRAERLRPGAVGARGAVPPPGARRVRRPAAAAQHAPARRVRARHRVTPKRAGLAGPAIRRPSLPSGLEDRSAGAHKHRFIAAFCGGQASPAPTWSSTARARTARARVRRAAARCRRAILSTRRVRRAVWLCRPRSVATASFLAAPWMQMYQHHPTQASPFALRSRRPVRLPSLLRRLRQPLLSSQRAARAVAGAAPRCVRGAAAHGARRKRAGVS